MVTLLEKKRKDRGPTQLRPEGWFYIGVGQKLGNPNLEPWFNWKQGRKPAVHIQVVSCWPIPICCQLHVFAVSCLFGVQGEADAAVMFLEIIFREPFYLNPFLW